MKKLVHDCPYASVVGIDVSKESVDVCLIGVVDGALFHQKVTNNLQGFQKMKTWLKQYSCELESDTLVCMEHTGLYTRKLVHYLMGRQVAVWLESSLQIKRSIGLQRGKDDKIDAQRIAKYALLHQGQANFVSLSSLTLEKLKDLQANRNRLKKALQSIQSTVKEMLELQQFTGGIFRQLIFFLLNKTDTVRGFCYPKQNAFFFCYTSLRCIQKQKVLPAVLYNNGYGILILF